MSESINPLPSSPGQPRPPLEAFTSSPELGKLFEALAKAQAEMEPAVMDMKNPHYDSHYASLTACQKAYRGPLSKWGLALTLQVFSMGGRYFIRTTLGHSSGQWQASVFELLIDKKNMQGLGSAVTYARRYSVNSIVGVVDKEDDDGERAMEGSAAEGAREEQTRQTHRAPPPVRTSKAPISPVKTSRAPAPAQTSKEKSQEQDLDNGYYFDDAEPGYNG